MIITYITQGTKGIAQEPVQEVDARIHVVWCRRMNGDLFYIPKSHILDVSNRGASLKIN